MPSGLTCINFWRAAADHSAGIAIVRSGSSAEMRTASINRAWFVAPILISLLVAIGIVWTDSRDSSAAAPATARQASMSVPF